MTEIDDLNKRIRDMESELVRLRRERIALSPAGSVDKTLVEQAMVYIRAHYTEQLSLADVANYLKVHESKLSTLFNAIMGTNYRDVLNRLRVWRAGQLLVGGKKMREAAMLVGYNDAHYFSKVFKRITGINASEYKRIKEA